MKLNVGILYICIGKYKTFWANFFASSESLLLPEVNKYYFVFTDQHDPGVFPASDNIRIIFQEDMGWPFNTLMRFHMFQKIKQELINLDYLIFFNANLKVCTLITAAEILPAGRKNLLAAIHPGFYNKQPIDYTFERNKRSYAYIPYGKGNTYVQGALLGGKSKHFLRACDVINGCTFADLNRDIIAVWHDESYWNRYILNRKDVLFVSPSYIYPEGWSLPFEQKIISLDKSNFGGHVFLRTSSS